MKTQLAANVLIILMLTLGSVNAIAKEKILLIDSYHEGYAWSDGIVRGIRNTLQGNDVELLIHHMDTKRNSGKGFIRKAAVRAKMEIEKIKPDVLIAADDNASKYLIKPFYKDTDLPVVFCGINWDASMYGYPYKNTTGMIEVASVPELLEYLKPSAGGERIAYIAADVPTARKEGLYYRTLYNLKISELYVKNFSEWAAGYKKIQNNCDILIIGNKAGISDWDDAKADKIVASQTKVPTGALYDFMAPFALVGYVKVPEEQGEWAAQAALKIIGGADIADIPVAKNKKGYLILNRKVADGLGIVFDDDTLTSAVRIIQ